MPGSVQQLTPCRHLRLGSEWIMPKTADFAAIVSTAPNSACLWKSLAVMTSGLISMRLWRHAEAWRRPATDWCRWFAPGDLVIHYDSRSEALVGVSVATGPAEPSPIFWVARGSYARRAGERPGPSLSS